MAKEAFIKLVNVTANLQSAIKLNNMTNDLKKEIIEKLTTLATAGFGLVAALAWNDAIQSFFKQIFGDQSGVWAKFIYAIIITILVVVVTTQLGRLANKLNDKS